MLDTIPHAPPSTNTILSLVEADGASLNNTNWQVPSISDVINAVRTCLSRTI
jgi:hypothetical protein